MNNKCARCEKTVYPIEELKCLDKIWHKGCFKCQECGMTLNMKSYKGFNKSPYCNAHVPQVKPTTTVNSLEARRLAELTKLQSNVKYHENFEKSKGKVTQIADDMETQRLKQTSKIISNVSYHNEFERKQQMEQKRNQVDEPASKVSNGNHLILKNNGNNTYHHLDSTAQQLNNLNLNNAYNKQQSFNNGQQSVYVQQKEPHNAQILHQQKLQAKQDVYQTQPQEYINPQKVAQYVNSSQQQQHLLHQQAQQRLINQQQQQFNNQQQQTNNQQQIAYQNQYNNQHNQFNGQDHFIQPNIYLQQKAQQNDWSPLTADQQNRVFRAMYDYTAADVDEVSFLDGDLITDVVFIDEGWMYGKISRTGQHGMLPANYVQPYIHS